jgi:hypothetical protein
MTGYETDHFTQNSEPGSSFGIVTEVSDVKTEEFMFRSPAWTAIFLISMVSMSALEPIQSPS